MKKNKVLETFFVENQNLFYYPDFNSEGTPITIN